LIVIEAYDEFIIYIRLTWRSTVDDVILVETDERGCGHREAGGVYLCTGLGLTGTPVWEYLLDPPLELPDAVQRFQGVHLAESMGLGWLVEQLIEEDVIGADEPLLVNMVGGVYYPTVPDWVEEVRAKGMSVRIQSRFDFSGLQGQVWVVQIHWRVVHVWSERQPEHEDWEYRYCGWQDDPVHFGECLYHLWPLAGLAGGTTRRNVGSMTYVPFNVIAAPLRAAAELDLTNAGAVTYRPGVFGVFPVDHLEVVKYVPETCNAADAGISVVVTEE
jgi:hypothetical protein